MKYILRKEVSRYKKNIKKLLEKNDCDFPVSLIKRVNLDEYLEKVMTCGKMIISLNEYDCVTGCVFYYSNNLETHVGFITLLCVDRDHRNHGIASRLLNHTFADMLNSGMKYCDLATNIENKKSISLYKKRGFKEVRIKNDEIFFRKRLEMNI